MLGVRPTLMGWPCFAEAGISRYIAQTEPFGPGSTEGPIYSSIEAGGEELRTFHRPCSQHGPETLYGHSAPGHGRITAVGGTPAHIPVPAAPRPSSQREKLGESGADASAELDRATAPATLGQ